MESMSRKRVKIPLLTLLDLPDDVLFAILSFCDIQSLGRLAGVCKRLSYVVRQDCVWSKIKKRFTVVNNYCEAVRYSDGVLSTQQRCALAYNWEKALCRDITVVHHRSMQLPWLQHDSHYLWVSSNQLIKCYKPRMNGLRSEQNKTLHAGDGDVSRFVSKNGLIVSGSRCGSIMTFSADTGKKLQHLRQCHNSDVQAVDCHEDFIVSGSRDATIKIWSMSGSTTQDSLLHSINLGSRVWSVAVNPDGRSFVAGTSGLNHVPPLQIWDADSYQVLGALGRQYKHGAGVLDLHFESPNILFSCGYDTYTRLWDLRCSYAQCVSIWEEPFDYTIYCVKSDGYNSFLTGTARHGMARLWDKRHTKHIQLYYSGHNNSSPVYSLAFDSSRLYLALDRGVHMLDFQLSQAMPRIPQAHVM